MSIEIPPFSIEVDINIVEIVFHQKVYTFTQLFFQGFEPTKNVYIFGKYECVSELLYVS
jgi:hypothetical protein